MPWKRTTTMGSWSEEAMKEAVNSVLTQTLSFRQAVERYGVPRSTLCDRVQGIKKNGEASLVPKLGRFEGTFTEVQERKLIQHVIELDDALMPLTKAEFLTLVYEYAEELGVDHRFNREEKTAGDGFYQSFMKRHPELSLRLAQNISVSRRDGFRKEQVTRFYSKLEELYTKYGCDASQVFNADETGVSTVHKNRMVMSLKNKKTVAKLASGERGTHVTIMSCFNALGYLLPLFFIFGGSGKKSKFMNGAMEGADACIQKSSWMTTQSFIQWLQHFVKYVKPSKEKPVILIVDGHSSHKHIDVLVYAKKNHIHMLSLPPHTTHKLQPLDVTLFKPFKSSYDKECSNWMRKPENHNAIIVSTDVAELVTKALERIDVEKAAQNGFASTGIWPFNPKIFADEAFVADKTKSHIGVTKETKILRNLVAIPERAVKKGGRAQEAEILTSTPYMEIAAESKRQRYKPKKNEESGLKDNKTKSSKGDGNVPGPSKPMNSQEEFELERSDLLESINNGTNEEEDLTLTNAFENCQLIDVSIKDWDLLLF